jgi:hypothetical protein
MVQGMKLMTQIRKAKHTGWAYPCRFTTAAGWERLGIVRWQAGAAYIHSMWADKTTHHHYRILARMAG